MTCPPALRLSARGSSVRAPSAVARLSRRHGGRRARHPGPCRSDHVSPRHNATASDPQQRSVRPRARLCLCACAATAAALRVVGIRSELGVELRRCHFIPASNSKI
ncbi:hypothetical protein GUJ93_ZPchr0014g46871 [Zizania palustris]|uniref:Uncharacterized protein n=1 Tax=Zizania palustris TaxID=103762 RepID=A0A8J5VUY7_ZIZPA|nr:hypothetical protein GUJ93_ZPchr0014g46871 [Zizania palustris]